MEVGGVGEGQRERERERTLSLPLPLTATSTKSFNLEWVPLSNHPVFLDHHRNSTKTTTATSSEPQPARFGINRGNLAVWDSVSSRLYLWDTDGKRLHRLSVRFGDPDDSDGTPSIQAACPSEVFLMDISTDSDIQHISLNRECSVMLLLGSDGLFIMYVFDRVRVSSDDDSIICRDLFLF
ncbi:hypothetical protein ZOSMA_132G00080 [Zostera marina]|uniref:Uncharacterized protein n=1 Tax=Zostera marina TaxID=29655 RepID=A0A0K9Q1B3_ZOSMR|nr:hypothetical protein ZOSMA_132G00080 [Zostera marina]